MSVYRRAIDALDNSPSAHAVVTVAIYACAVPFLVFCVVERAIKKAMGGA